MLREEFEAYRARDPATLTDEEVAGYDNARWQVGAMQALLRDDVIAERMRIGHQVLTGSDTASAPEWVDRLLALSV
jgi:hypothetical protein